MEPFTDLQAAIDEIRPVFPSRRGSETIPDLPDPFDAWEKAGEERLQGDLPGKNHRPEGFGKIVRSPAELVCIVQDIREKLRRAIRRVPGRPEGLMVEYGVGDVRTFAIVK